MPMEKKGAMSENSDNEGAQGITEKERRSFKGRIFITRRQRMEWKELNRQQIGASENTGNRRIKRMT